MSLFQCYGSDSEDESEEKNNNTDDQFDNVFNKRSLNETSFGTIDQFNKNDIDDKEYSDYDVDRKLSIDKVLEKPYGIKVEDNDEVTMEEAEVDKDLAEQENMDYETSRKKKQRFLEPVYAMKNNLIHTTLENSTPPIANNKTPPTPTLYSPPYMSNPPTSTNPSFSGLYPNISSPIPTTVNDDPQPEDEADERMREKIIKLHKMKQDGINFNDSLRKSTAFKNPSILEKLISFCEIKENGTNLPTAYFNPDGVKPDEFYSQLEAKQREMEEKKEKERLRIDQSAPPKPSPSINKKKSQWNKYSQSHHLTSKPAAANVSKSVKVGAVITSAPSTVVKKKEEEKPQPQINSIFKRRR